MSAVAVPVPVGSDKVESQNVKQWAAEHVAISIGLLRECPYHGQPYKAHKHGLSAAVLEAGLLDPLDPAVQVFKGNTRELLAVMERVTRGYGERCAMCVASDHDDLD